MHLCNRVDRRSKSQNISELAFSLNRYHNSATPLFYSETQSDISFLIIQDKDNHFFREIQIVLTLRNTLSTVNLQRFAAASLRDVLYYEASFGRERPTVSSVAARPRFNGNFVPKAKGVT